MQDVRTRSQRRVAPQDRYPRPMCRSIVKLRGETPASEEEVRAAARQFVRKISGYREPSRKNAEAFEAAVEEIATSSRRLLDAVSSPA
jgi:hypothetical protein